MVVAPNREIGRKYKIIKGLLIRTVTCRRWGRPYTGRGGSQQRDVPRNNNNNNAMIIIIKTAATMLITLIIIMITVMIYR